MKVEHEDANQKGHGRDEVKIDSKLEPYRDKIIGMMTKSKSMWIGPVDPMSVSKHRIKLPSDNNPLIYGAPYRAGTKAREFKKTEIY